MGPTMASLLNQREEDARVPLGGTHPQQPGGSQWQ